MGEYAWVWEQPIVGLALEGGLTSHAVISGAPREEDLGAAIQLAVRDSAGTVVRKSFPLQIHRTPNIANVSLPDACVNEVYNVQLLATGGDAATYVWAAELPEDVGLALTNDEIEGLIARAGSFEVKLSLTDQYCKAESRTYSLIVNDATNTICPKILVDGILDWQVTPACKGEPYLLKLDELDGRSPYAWHEVATPAGLTFNRFTQELSGTATAAGEFIIRATDSASRTVQQTYAIAVRDKCWFAYTSNETGRQRLQLIDPFVPSSKRTLPETATNTEEVVDFNFSPNGLFLACQLKDTNETTRLVLLEAPRWQETSLPLLGTVTQFSWSDDSSVLAVASSVDEQTELSGVALSSGNGGMRLLDRTPAPIDSPLVWFGNEFHRFVAFHSASGIGPTVRSIHSSELGPAKFADPVSPNLTLHVQPLVLHPSSSGYFVLNSDPLPLAFFYPFSQTTYFLHDNPAIDAHGDYVAIATEDELRLFRPTDTSHGASATPWAASSGCKALLAWSRDAHKIGCLAADQKTVSIFTFSDSGVVQPLTVGGVYDYGDDLLKGQRRMLSKSGHWLAFTSDKYFYVAKIDSDSAAVNRAYFLQDASAGAPPPSASPAVIDYSPTEEYVVVQANGNLAVCHTDRPDLDCTKWLVSPRNAIRCQEDVLSAATWCGAAKSLDGIVWSPDSGLVATQTTDGSIQLLDLRRHMRIDFNDTCAEGCVGGYQFQP